jgi:antitoxin (DNA-binding transcriptional repressor) of toxin-antitoxin stability system
VNISDLKAQLSAHIQLVKDGEGVLVCDRLEALAA